MTCAPRGDVPRNFPGGTHRLTVAMHREEASSQKRLKEQKHLRRFCECQICQPCSNAMSRRLPEKWSEVLATKLHFPRVCAMERVEQKSRARPRTRDTIEPRALRVSRAHPVTQNVWAGPGRSPCPIHFHRARPLIARPGQLPAGLTRCPSRSSSVSQHSQPTAPACPLR